MEDGVVVVPALGQHEEVLARARRHVAVQLQVEVAQAGVQAHVALLLGAALHAHHCALVLSRHVHRRRRERTRRRACRRSTKTSKPLTQSEAPGPILNFSGPKAPDGLWVGQIYYPKVLLVAFTVVNENDKMPRPQPQCRSHTVI